MAVAMAHLTQSKSIPGPRIKVVVALVLTVLMSALVSVPIESGIDRVVPDKVQSVVVEVLPESVVSGLGVTAADAGWWDRVKCGAAITAAVAAVAGVSYLFWSLGGVLFTFQALAAGALTVPEVLAVVGSFPLVVGAIDRVMRAC